MSLGEDDLLEIYDEIETKIAVLEKPLKDKFEKAATDKSIDCGFGVSEWESFMPDVWHDLQKAKQLIYNAARKIHTLTN